MENRKRGSFRFPLFRMSVVALMGAGFFSACQSGPRVTENAQAATVNESLPLPPVIPIHAKEDSTAPAFDLKLSANSVPDGSLVLLTITPRASFDQDSLRVKFEDVEFPAFHPTEQAAEYEALVVMPFNSKPRKSRIEVEWKVSGKSRSAEIPVEVIDGRYRSEKLTVEGSKIDPPKKTLKRIMAEVKEIGSIYRHSDRKKYWTGAFSLPIDSEVTSPFGNKRVYNGKMKSFHQGLDLRARTPLPIHAPANGRIALAKDLYFTGWTVIIDHGYDLFTIYGHMSRLDVKAGDMVTNGTQLGLSGATGRASGPHLHWGAVLVRQKFNPEGLTRVLH
ncbi:MAG: M23 family metallopeptidase [Cryobacterium sp.]|nr:M23 family metallopeptidase [Oligoflexia bacterium]